jgi:hypothetical protein
VLVKNGGIESAEKKQMLASKNESKNDPLSRTLGSEQASSASAPLARGTCIADREALARDDLGEAHTQEVRAALLIGSMPHSNTIHHLRLPIIVH